MHIKPVDWDRWPGFSYRERGHIATLQRRLEFLLDIIANKPSARTGFAQKESVALEWMLEELQGSRLEAENNE